jgi:disulfide bond formation protein DsbB
MERAKVSLAVRGADGDNAGTFQMHVPMNPFRWSFRAQFLSGFVVCVLLLAAALYTQYFQNQIPCPLCTFQRGAFALLGLLFLIGGLHAPKGRGGRATYGVLAVIPAVVGLGIAGRHVWLQHLPPDQVPACGPDLAYMMEAFPMGAMLRQVLTGSGECAEVTWRLLGLSMPEWSLLWFVALAIWLLVAAFRSRKPDLLRDLRS